MSRRVFSVAETPFLTYDLDGPVQPEMSWLPITYTKENRAVPISCACSRAR